MSAPMAVSAQGKVSGVIITILNVTAGAAYKIRIRGTSVLTGITNLYTLLMEFLMKAQYK